MNVHNIKIHRVVCGSLDNNTYLLQREGRNDCIVVDPADGDITMDALRELRLDVAQILLTHGHFDHIMGVDTLRTETGAPVAVHVDDAAMLSDAALNLGKAVLGLNVSTSPPERRLRDGDMVDAADISLKVLHTPGHSPGSCCFLLGTDLLTGDTLFYRGAGRTDLCGGNTKSLVTSIRRLFALPGDMTLYPGHGQASTMSFERVHNTFMKNYS